MQRSTGLNFLQNRLGRFYGPVVLILTSLILFAMMFNSVLPKPLDLKLYEVAGETIRANATIEDKQKTKEAKSAAEANIAPVYTYNPDLAESQRAKVESLFTSITKVKEAVTKTDAAAKKKNKKAVATSTAEKTALLKENYFADAKQTDYYAGFPDWFYNQLFELSDRQLQTMQKVTLVSLGTAMDNAVRANELGRVKQKAVDNLNISGLNADEQNLVKLVLNASIISNETYNNKETELQKQAAIERVQPVMILQGQVIVQEGHVVDKNMIHQLKLLGLLGQQTSYYPIYGLICFLMLQMMIMFHIAQKQLTDQRKRDKMILLYAVMMILSVLVMRMCQLIQVNSSPYIAFIFPAGFVPLVMSLFISRKSALVATIFQSLAAIFIFSSLLGSGLLMMITLFYAFSGAVACLVPHQRLQKQLKETAFWLILTCLFLMITLVLYQGMNPRDQDFWYLIACGSFGVLLTYLLSIGLHPYIELLMTSDSQLVLNELSSPEQPLLKRLLEETPGTYNHSLMVANLSANAVSKIGGRVQLSRVACYYHDVGKLIKPYFFVENLPPQMQNPHDYLLPEESAQIIFSHVTEGVKMLEEAKMPQFVIDICAQHHGTTLMKFFYHKAKESDETVKESGFRYPGPKPQTKEAAVINIADSAEAATRSMKNPTLAKINEFVHQLIQSRILDGQFNECNITLQELTIVEKSIVEGLSSTFHSRIEYPQDDPKGVKENAN